MFNNLIESSSHTKEYKRRGSFLLFTGACYVVLFVVMGVVSIYAYDARMEQQILEDVVLLSPQDVVTPEPARAAQPDRPRDTSNNTSNITERAVAMLSVNHPEVVPTEISATPSKNPPLPDGPGIVAITGRNRDAARRHRAGANRAGTVAPGRWPPMPNHRCWRPVQCSNESWRTIAAAPPEESGTYGHTKGRSDL